MYKVLATIFVLFPGIAPAQNIDLITKPGEWSEEQLKLMRKAAYLVYKRMPNTMVAKCAFRNATRGKPDRDKWARDMAVIRRSDDFVVRIEKGELGSNTLGRAKVGIARKNRHGVGYANLHIILSADHFNYHYRDKAMHRDPDSDTQQYNVEQFWAKTITHEIAHNLGLNHGPGKDWDENYRGYFITELSACVMNDGRFGTIKRN